MADKVIQERSYLKDEKDYVRNFSYNIKYYIFLMEIPSFGKMFSTQHHNVAFYCLKCV